MSVETGKSGFDPWSFDGFKCSEELRDFIHYIQSKEGHLDFKGQKGQFFIDFSGLALIADSSGQEELYLVRRVHSNHVDVVSLKMIRAYRKILTYINTLPCKVDPLNPPEIHELTNMGSKPPGSWSNSCFVRLSQEADSNEENNIMIIKEGDSAWERLNAIAQFNLTDNL